MALNCKKDFDGWSWCPWKVRQGIVEFTARMVNRTSYRAA